MVLFFHHIPRAMISFRQAVSSSRAQAYTARQLTPLVTLSLGAAQAKCQQLSPPALQMADCFGSSLHPSTRANFTERLKPRRRHTSKCSVGDHALALHSSV